MLLRCYLDDSDIGQGTFSILAGWIGPEERWAPFEDEWKNALAWRSLSRFKMSEFLGRSGEFAGWSDESRNIFIRYVMNLVRERAFKGIGVVLQNDIYQKVFGKDVVRPFNVPYALLFFQLISITLQRFDYADVERIDFVFDEQHGQMNFIRSEWQKFKKAAPSRLQCKLGAVPRFVSDTDEPALQAADLYAGWIRRLVPHLAANSALPDAPWAGQEPTIDSFTDYFTAEGLAGAHAALFGPRKA